MSKMKKYIAMAALFAMVVGFGPSIVKAELPIPVCLTCDEYDKICWQPNPLWPVYICWTYCKKQSAYPCPND